jgi:hypothetical protein
MATPKQYLWLFLCSIHLLKSIWEHRFKGEGYNGLQTFRNHNLQFQLPLTFKGWMSDILTHEWLVNQLNVQYIDSPTSYWGTLSDTHCVCLTQTKYVILLCKISAVLITCNLLTCEPTQKKCFSSRFPFWHLTVFQTWWHTWGKKNMREEVK